MPFLSNPRKGLPMLKYPIKKEKDHYKGPTSCYQGAVLCNKTFKYNGLQTSI